jgi:hypothetical protein
MEMMDVATRFIDVHRDAHIAPGSDPKACEVQSKSPLYG